MSVACDVLYNRDLLKLIIDYIPMWRVFLRPVSRELSKISRTHNSVQLWRAVVGLSTTAPRDLQYDILRELICESMMPTIWSFIGHDDILGSSYYILSWRQTSLLSWGKMRAIPYGAIIYHYFAKKSLECVKAVSEYISIDSGIVNASLIRGRMDIIEWYHSTVTVNYNDNATIDQFAACILYKADKYDKTAVRGWFEDQFIYTTNAVKLFMKMRMTVDNFNAALTIIRERAPQCVNAMASLNYINFVITAGNMELLQARLTEYSVLLGVGAPIYTNMVYTALAADQFDIANYIVEKYRVNEHYLWGRMCGSTLVKAISWYMNTYGYNDILAGNAIDQVPNNVSGAKFIQNLSEYFSNLMYLTACTRAAARGKRLLIRILHDAGCAWGPQTIQAALIHEHDEVADWLIVRGCPSKLEN